MAAENIARFKQLETELSELREQTRTELIELAEKCVANLRELGFEYELREKVRRGRRAGAAVVGAGRAKVCPICGAAGHGRRFHKQPRKAAAGAGSEEPKKAATAGGVAAESVKEAAG